MRVSQTTKRKRRTRTAEPGQKHGPTKTQNNQQERLPDSTDQESNPLDKQGQGNLLNNQKLRNNKLTRQFTEQAGTDTQRTSTMTKQELEETSNQFTEQPGAEQPQADRKESAKEHISCTNKPTGADSQR